MPGTARAAITPPVTTATLHADDAIGGERTRAPAGRGGSSSNRKNSSGGALSGRLADRAPVEVAADHDLGPDRRAADPAGEARAPVDVVRVVALHGTPLARPVLWPRGDDAAHPHPRAQQGDQVRPHGLPQRRVDRSARPEG